MLIIPLTKKQSRGDQILNAKAFEEKGYSFTLGEDYLNQQSLITGLEKVYKNRENLKKAMELSEQSEVLHILVEEIHFYR